MGCDQETVRAAEKIILPGDRDCLGYVPQIRVRATCQRDEFSLCTSKFVSDMPSHAVSLRDVSSPFAEVEDDTAAARGSHLWEQAALVIEDALFGGGAYKWLDRLAGPDFDPCAPLAC